jgi:hypothetical protein
MSCLFDSISYFLPLDSYQLRQKTCNYLEDNKPIMNDLDTKFILSLDNKNYIKNMRDDDAWGGGIEISAIANMYSLKIIVKNLRNGKQIEFLPLSKQYNTILYISWNGNHFEPLSSIYMEEA